VSAFKYDDADTVKDRKLFYVIPGCGEVKHEHKCCAYMTQSAYVQSVCEPTWDIFVNDSCDLLDQSTAIKLALCTKVNKGGNCQLVLYNCVGFCVANNNHCDLCHVTEEDLWAIGEADLGCVECGCNSQ
jgi:hypothetical protein